MTMMASTSQAPRVGVIICSTRKPRACPQIARFVIDTIKTTTTTGDGDGDGDAASLELIDLEEWNLPLSNESDVPSQIRDSAQYDHVHTRNWSAEIVKYDAFIFVTSQYNWGYPASLKNAIDYLYHEWKGKRALIVTYGGHGGGKCGAQLRQVLMGVNMIPTTQNVELSFESRERTIYAARGNDLRLDGIGGTGVWSGAERTRIAELYKELISSLANTSAPLSHLPGSSTALSGPSRELKLKPKPLMH
ncbi:hypothetical protein IAU59_007335 [Kwoniella sp. CBS 9459]